MPSIKLALLMRPFEDFFKRQVSGGIVLIVATLLALLLANSPWSATFHHFWETSLTVGGKSFGLTKSLHHWINDGLMAVFFFVVGLEIKREFLAGELASARKAALPIAAAVGGMLVPAAIYVIFNWQQPSMHGWGVPMATDIAFALGVIALLGKRIPRSLAIFLTALAIVDDLGAVLVIALFYTSELSWLMLGIVAALFVVLCSGNRLGIQHPNFYSLVGFCLWVALLKSGVHASIAGILIGATIPVKPRHEHKEFVIRAEQLMERYKTYDAGTGPFYDDERLGTLLALEHSCHDAMSPLQRMEHAMNPWVIFGVMPVFALANAGITLDLSGLSKFFIDPVTLGILCGLMIGKPLGILSFAWLAVRLKLCDLPQGSTWKGIFGIGILGGIGFTMSMFISNLAFLSPETILSAKVGIFAASLLAGVTGYALLATNGKRGDD
ncbi:MAG: Na+/H+ antiporter NhaA [Desulfuromonadales bacterium]|nr:Na+/H+ antiporter NhaA [Desulfuromonadales bacterium]MDT8422502.1 Na+/H+ antiporter NhaA [Desulfuromonadales bacterium]